MSIGIIKGLKLTQSLLLLSIARCLATRVWGVVTGNSEAEADREKALHGVSMCACVRAWACVWLRMHWIEQVFLSLLIWITGWGSITDIAGERGRCVCVCVSVWMVILGAQSIRAPPRRTKWAVPEFPRGLDDIIHRCLMHYSSTLTHTSLAPPTFCSNWAFEYCVAIINLEWRIFNMQQLQSSHRGSVMTTTEVLYVHNTFWTHTMLQQKKSCHINNVYVLWFTALSTF